MRIFNSFGPLGSGLKEAIYIFQAQILLHCRLIFLEFLQPHDSVMQDLRDELDETALLTVQEEVLFLDDLSQS